ncbi:DNA-(apurinic or apyrimidinic site) lyase [Diplonema papillatum]|nr:DNA-(apurinic or apyrimidinic site) lyase [Diplonema papillatum]
MLVGRFARLVAVSRPYQSFVSCSGSRRPDSLAPAQFRSAASIMPDKRTIDDIEAAEPAPAADPAAKKPKPAAKKAVKKPPAKKAAGKKSGAAVKEEEEGGGAAAKAKPAAKRAKKAVEKPPTEPPKDALMTGAERASGPGVLAPYQGYDLAGAGWNIVSWNVNGIRAVTQKFEVFAALVERERPDIICLQETKIDAEKVKAFDSFLKDYKTFWSCCTTAKAYSGVGVLIREDLVKLCKVTTDPLPAAHSKEGRLLAVETPDFYLVATYVPNAGDGLKRLDYRVKEWDPSLRDYLTGLASKKGKGVIWAGDLNVAHTPIDLANPATNSKSAGFTPEERASFSETLAAGFTDTFRYFHPEEPWFYTYWGYRTKARPKNMGWRLDYFVVNNDFLPKVKASGILPWYDGSDHCPIQLLLKKE